jgi:iron complex outermembrane recepter protein
MRSKQSPRIHGVCRLLGMATLLLPTLATAGPHDTTTVIEEVIVTAPFLKTAAETALPVGVLSGDELRERVSNSLGDTLKHEIGMSSSSFGTSVGHPIIRGQSGNRVLVLQGGIGVTDASNTSPDHAEGVEPILADRLEVVRGPSTLLYGSGAVGGVVNVIDNRIPATLPETTSLVAEQSRNSVNDENKTVLRVDAPLGTFAIHADYFSRNNNNVSIPGFAVDEAALESQEELLHGHDDEGHEDDGNDDEEIENSAGFIRNSDAEADGGTIGISLIGDRGFLGFSVGRMTSDYGLPGGSHEHHEEDHDEEHGDDHGEEADVEFVRIDLDKSRYDLRGELRFDNSFFETVRGSIAYTDYQHAEIEYFTDGEQEVGTLYTNKGTEGRATLSHAEVAGWSGVWGLQFSQSRFAASGEEAFIPASDVANIGLFAIERMKRENLILEFGARIDANKVDPASGCNMDESAFSLGGSLIYHVNDATDVMVTASRSERTPTVEELFSNVNIATCDRFADNEDLVLHAATNLLEVGNPNLDSEAASNVDLGIRWYGDHTEAEFNVYRNVIDDYIFLGLTNEEHDEILVASYLANDATFTGLEGKLSWRLIDTSVTDLTVGVFADRVHARFDRGGHIPRIPSAKFGVEFRLAGENWTMHWHTTRVTEQDRVGDLELPTAAYTSMSLYADYHWRIRQRSELQLFARGTNLLDQEIRNHTSFVKNLAPDPGRALTVGVRFRY